MYVYVPKFVSMCLCMWICEYVYVYVPMFVCVYVRVSVVRGEKRGKRLNISQSFSAINFLGDCHLSLLVVVQTFNSFFKI